MANQYYDYIGGKIYLDTGESRMMEASTKSEYEATKLSKMINTITRGMVCVDVGACVGYFTHVMAKLVGEKGKVIAFEPYKPNYDRINKGAEANKYRNTTVLCCALSNVSRVNTPLYVGKFPGWGSLIYNEVAAVDKNTIEVPTQKLDEVFTIMGIEKIDAMKIDVEGAELLVLEGAKEILSKNNMHLFIDLHGEEMITKVPAFLKELNYKVEWLEKKEIYCYKVVET